MLAYQFTAGLLPVLRYKVAGVGSNLHVSKRLIYRIFLDVLVTPKSSRDTTSASGHKKPDGRSVHDNSNQRCFQCNGVAPED